MIVETLFFNGPIPHADLERFEMKIDPARVNEEGLETLHRFILNHISIQVPNFDFDNFAYLINLSDYTPPSDA